jgi:hypothetical protein
VASVTFRKFYPVPNGYEAGWAAEPVWTLRRVSSFHCLETNPPFLGRPASSLLKIQKKVIPAPREIIKERTAETHECSECSKNEGFPCFFLSCKANARE